MVKSRDNGFASVAPFLKKCYEMVDDGSTDSIISWSENGDSFVISDMTEFSVQLLPKYFKHNNSASFIRQLNIYGFRKVDTDCWEFANDGFVKGQKHLLKSICRRKNSQGTENPKPLQQQDNSTEYSEKVENSGLWKDVENLKSNKNVVTQELVKIRQHQENTEDKLILLRDRLKGMEKNQQQMLSFLVMVVQNPAFLVQLLQSKEINWRMSEPGTIVEQDADYGDPLPSDGMIVKYQPPFGEVPKPVQGPSVSSEKPQESIPSSDGAKDFFISPEFMKVLMDENLSFENHGPPILPELSDDSTWEKLFLSNPFLDNIDHENQDNEESTDADIEMETTGSRSKLHSEDFEYLVEQMENSENRITVHGTHMEKSDNMEILTKQMGLLASETDHEYGVWQ